MGTLARKKNNLKSDLSRIDWELYGSQVIGTDEVGRGCLAGPVCAAAVYYVNRPSFEDQLTDSKKLTPKKRDELFEIIIASNEIIWGFAHSTVQEIDELNILQASFLAMSRAVDIVKEKIKNPVSKKIPILIDGHLKSPLWPSDIQIPIIKGDLRCSPISAASIIAKVLRDRWMTELAQEYPVYGLEKHKGYLTEVHRMAIQKNGIADIHRRSFRGAR